jgi:hypothetical protein
MFIQQWGVENRLIRRGKGLFCLLREGLFMREKLAQLEQILFDHVAAGA